jgi:hypothetical protein
MVKDAGKKSDQGTLKREKDEEQASSRTKNTYLKEPYRRPPMDPQRLG